MRLEEGDGKRMLLEHVRRRDYENLEMLLIMGVKSDYRYAAAMTLLMFAAHMDDGKMIDLLLKYRANEPNLFDMHRKTALDYANPKSEIHDQLRSVGAKTAKEIINVTIRP